MGHSRPKPTNHDSLTPSNLPRPKGSVKDVFIAVGIFMCPLFLGCAALGVVIGGIVLYWTREQRRADRAAANERDEAPVGH
ncbi:unnamed protein product [Cutaneotrichosporon oleaginosum]